MIPELESAFSTPETRFTGVFTELDVDAPANDPGLITRAARIMMDAGIAEAISADSVITHLRTGARYAVKTRKLSGVGVVQLDLERIMDRKTSERNF